MKTIRIDVFSHNVKVYGFSYRGKEALLDYCRGMAQYGLSKVAHNRFVRVMLRVFAASTADRSEFRFQKSQLEDLLRHLNFHGFTSAEIEINVREVLPGVPADMRMHKHILLRDYQVPIVEFLVFPAPVKVVTLQTGKGKTLCALKACAEIGKRTFLVIKGMYVEKWVSDVREAYQLKAGELIVVRGSAQLKDLMALAEAGELDCKFIICTNKTLYNYLEDYEKFKKDITTLGFPFMPEEFFEKLGVGVRLIDEVHQDFHLNFRLDLYTNVETTINLSATLESDDPFMNRMYEVAFPMKSRFQGAVYDKYIAVKALVYTMNNPNKIRWKAKGRGSYSHIMFEESLMKDKALLARYLEMITIVVENSYIVKREDGQKMLIFAASVQLCGIIAEHLASKWPSLAINRYVSEDNYEVLLSSDIAVSTLKSAGTAVDIPGLMICLMTDALGSKQGNSQALGRLRVLKDWPGITPEFLYLVCRDIPKHIEYHERKVENFSDKVLSHKTLTMNYRL